MVLDLSTLKKPPVSEDPHRYAVICHFRVSEEDMAVITADKEAIDRGEQRQTSHDLPLGGDNMLLMQGPGCIKCGAHWEDPVRGYKVMCAVSDEVFVGRTQGGNSTGDGRVVGGGVSVPPTTLHVVTTEVQGPLS